MEDAMNGYTNGSFKGSKPINGINGHTMMPRRRTPPRKANPSFFVRILSIATRLLVWYSIYAIIFRCPSSLDACDESSPKICGPYLQAKQVVSPHLAPYYDRYAAPYVDSAKPYYDKLDDFVITPARTYAVKYGGPKLAKAQALGQAKWEKNVQPRLTEYQARAKSQYDEKVAPHVQKVSDVVRPYYEVARTNALHTYHDVLLPSYEFVHPHALHGYETVRQFTVETAVPSTIWAWNKTYVFLDSTVWPSLRDVYVLKVEPQLVRIGQRLGRYNGKRLSKASVVENAESPSTKSTLTKPSAPIPSRSADVEDVSGFESPKGSARSETRAAPVEAETPLTREEVRDIAAKTVHEDLDLWTKKFSHAADESGSEIEDHIAEVAKRMIEQEANVKGKALVSQLDETVKAQVPALKETLVAILDGYDSSDKERFDEQIATAIRSTGLEIKSKAQDVRTWRTGYEEELELAITKVADEHIRILEGIRDLALQKIGMKWAWMDGVTYKDWQKYHQLRDTLEEWTDDVKRLVTTHPALEAAQVAAIDIENEAMAIAGEAAKQLGELKQVAGWKAIAGDKSDNFDASTIKLAAEAAEKKAAEAAEALKHAAEGAQESISSALLSETPTTSTVEFGETQTITISLHKVNTDDSVVPPLESTTSEPTESATDLASDFILADTPIVVSNASAADTEPTESLLMSEPVEEPIDGPEQIEETIVETPDEPTASVEPSTTAVKSALFGAAAQAVPSMQPIMDEDMGSSISSAIFVVLDDVKEAPASITSAAHAAYTNAIGQAADQYARALSAVSAQISGEPKPAHEEMFSSVSSAYFDAMGTANAKLQSALAVASEGVYGTPTTKWMPEMPTMPSVEWEKIQSMAQQNLQDGINWAGEQFESAKVAIGVAEPTPSTAAEKVNKMMDQAQHQYYAGLGVAHARYEEFLAAASSGLSSLTATPTPTNMQESASSVASAAGESASSVASVAAEKAASAKAAASESFEALVSRISEEVYGRPTPTPWYENLYAQAGDYASQAGDYAASATEALGDNVSSITSLANEQYSAATEAAASQYNVVSSLVSELILGKEPTFTESVYSRLAEAYSIATANVASVASEATGSVASAASVASDTVSSMTEKVKDTVEQMKDEL